MGLLLQSAAVVHAGRAALSSEPVVFGPFAKVWNELGAVDSHIRSLRSAAKQSAVCDVSTDDLHTPPTDMDKDTAAEEMSQDGEPELLDQGSVESTLPQRRRSWQECNPERAATGRFSQVWDQLQSLDFDLRDSQRSEEAAGAVEPTSAAEQACSPDTACLGSVTVVTISGDMVGEYAIERGMTVSSLRDRIAHTRGDLPFTLTLVWGSEVLNDAFELRDIARQSVPERIPVTLLYSAPNFGGGAFSKVWDSLGQLGTSLGNLG